MVVLFFWFTHKVDRDRERSEAERKAALDAYERKEKGVKVRASPTSRPMRRVSSNLLADELLLIDGQPAESRVNSDVASKPLNKAPRKKRVPLRAEDADRTNLEDRIRTLIAAKQEAADSGDVSRLSELEKEYRVLVRRFIKQFGRESWENLRREVAESAQPMAFPSQDFDERTERKQKSRVVTDPRTDDLVEEMKKRALRGTR